MRMLLLPPVATCLLVAGLALSAGRGATPRPQKLAPPSSVPFKPVVVPGTDLTLQPEAARQYKRLVIGLEPNRTRFFMLPSTEAFDPRPTNPRVRRLRRQIYWLNYELTHGSIVKAAPPHTRFFVAVPDPALVAESVGNEEEVFRDYLATRLGWTSAQIAARVSFFKVPYHITFPRDIAEPLGVDGKGRLVLGIGSESQLEYREAVHRLATAFPNDFAARDLPGIETEGGDLELAWMPDNRLGLFVGHHRIRHWVERKVGQSLEGQALSPTQIEEARLAHQKAFFGVPVQIICEEDLRNPHLVSEELFHMDMVLNVVRSGEKLLAFVPSYSEQPVDAISHQALAEGVRSRVQKAYDRVANQVAALGYRVIRLPFADHPVRGPVNFNKYTDPTTGDPVVLLGRYPYHLPGENGRSPQLDLQQTFDRLRETVERWRLTPTDSSWARVEALLTETWKAVDLAAASPNPTFSSQASVYESLGIRVIPVSLYPTGEGGLHCLGLSRLDPRLFPAPGRTSVSALWSTLFERKMRG